MSDNYHYVIHCKFDFIVYTTVVTTCDVGLESIRVTYSYIPRYSPAVRLKEISSSYAVY